MNRLVAVVLVVLLVGCSSLAPVTAPTKDATTTPGPEPATTVGPGPAAGQDTATTRRPDPTRDVQGWEQGYWHNESLALTTEDGLNESEQRALVHRTMARVEVLRDVEFRYDVPYAVVSRDDLTGSGTGADASAEAARTVQNTRYEALFLLSPHRNASRESAESRRQNLAGYYVPASDQLVIVVDGNASQPIRLREGVVAHELAHAVQFRQFGGEMAPAGQRGDAWHAWRSLLEGEATLVMERYGERCGTEWECVSYPDTAESGTERDGSTRQNQGLLLEQAFPYVAGRAYVKRVVETHGWSGLAARYGAPPVSTEQVIFPDAGAADTPRSVDLPAVRNDSWTRLRPDDGPAARELGARDVAIMFAYTARDGRPGAVGVPGPDREVGPNGPISPETYRVAAADGWAGDRFAVYEDESGRTGYVWRLAWDDPAEARAFAASYRDLLAYHRANRLEAGSADTTGSVWRFPPDSRFDGVVTLRVDGDRVTIVHEPTRGALDVA